MKSHYTIQVFKPKAEDGSPNPYIDYDEYKISGKKQGNQYTYNFHSSLERTYRKLDFEVKPKEITPKNIQLILDAYSPGSYVKDGFRFEDETFMGKITHIECKEKKKSEFGGVAGWELTIQQTRPDGQQATYTLLGDTNKIAESLKIRISKKSDATPGQTTGALKY